MEKSIYVIEQMCKNNLICECWHFYFCAVKYPRIVLMKAKALVTELGYNKEVTHHGFNALKTQLKLDSF